MSIHFSSVFDSRHQERERITEALRRIDPPGVAGGHVTWYVSGDVPKEGVHIYTVMNESGTFVVSAFSVRSLVKRLEKEEPLR